MQDSVKTHQTVHSDFVYFTVCKIYLEKIKVAKNTSKNKELHLVVLPTDWV